VVPPLAHVLAGVLDDVEAVPTPAPEAQPVPAAVLVALDAPPQLEEPARRLGEIRVVLTKRRPGLRRHAGEISFPGGRLDPSDRTLYETALREVEEEIGLPREEVTPVGALAVVHTIATNYVIQPFVGLVDLGARPGGVEEGASGGVVARWRTSAHEVEEVLELTLQVIESGRGRTRLERRGIRFETDTFTVGEHLIWGATFRILDDLLGRLRSGD
jgi:8-oxo-dGTP pyrophosphatase MutT (NUDIX family)